MERVGRRVWVVVCFVAVSLLIARQRAAAVSLDKEGDIKLGVRTYVNARVGTENTDQLKTNEISSFTFPYSAAGHVRQNRAFVEAEFDHDLSRLQKEGWGPLDLLNSLPFKIKDLKYHLVFRGEADSVYDWGGTEYSTAHQYQTCQPGQVYGCLTTNPATGSSLNILAARRHLRQLGTDRERLFQGYVEGSVGNLFVRFGRQIMAWGETDGFRLLDNINPVDSSFGGFLISLDERRTPLDMLRAQYFLGSLGPFSEAFVEMYGAIDNKVGYAPGTAAGSPWALPNLGDPSRTTETQIITPARTFSDMRGGGRFQWNMYDATFSLAHYYTYFDTPGVQVHVKPGFPSNPADPTQESFGYPSPNLKGPLPNGYGSYSALAVQTAPLVQVSGATTTFALPQFYSVVRSELAYFRNEPRFRQAALDPFIFHFYDIKSPDFRRLTPTERLTATTGGLKTGSSINFVLGWDKNQWIRFLNPNQTVTFSTQFFYKHLESPTRRQQIAPPSQRTVLDGEVLPVPRQNVLVTAQGLNSFGPVEPNLIRQNTDQFLQTLVIFTSYYSGRINPAMVVFYDWSGAFVYQPSIGFLRDPFRFYVDYSILDAHTLKGNSGVSLLKDRDNVQFRFEYVI